MMQRNFLAGAPDTAGVRDFTYVPAGAGFTYVSFVIDLFSRRILSWATLITNDIEFMQEARRMTLWQRRHGSGSHRSSVQGTVHHSDAGSEYLGAVHADVGR